MAKQRTIKGPDPVNADMVLVECTVDDRGIERECSYSMLKDAEAFRRAVANAKSGAVDENDKPAKGSLEWFYNFYDYALGLDERADVRKAVAVQSTIIRIKGKDFDLMSLPTEKLIPGVNGALLTEATTGKIAPSAFKVAKAKLLESGKARLVNASEPDGGIVPA